MWVDMGSEARKARRVFEALGLTEREVAFLHQYYLVSQLFNLKKIDISTYFFSSLHMYQILNVCNACEHP